MRDAARHEHEMPGVEADVLVADVQDARAGHDVEDLVDVWVLLALNGSRICSSRAVPPSAHPSSVSFCGSPPPIRFLSRKSGIESDRGSTLRAGGFAGAGGGSLTGGGTTGDGVTGAAVSAADTLIGCPARTTMSRSSVVNPSRAKRRR